MKNVDNRVFDLTKTGFLANYISNDFPISYYRGIFGVGLLMAMV
jgi:hypothetical protein